MMSSSLFVCLALVGISFNLLLLFRKLFDAHFLFLMEVAGIDDDSFVLFPHFTLPPLPILL